MSQDSATLTGEFWDNITGIYSAILDHPFLTGLTDGSLPQEAFAFYVVQDALYLQEYARALAIVGSRAPDAGATRMFAEHAANAIAVERSLHAELLPALGLDPALVDAATPAPTNLAYTSYLLATAQGGSYAEGVAAVLPCYWIYWEVGKELLRRGSPDARYQRWIDTYGGEDFGAVVTDVLAVADQLRPDDATRARLIKHFVTTSRYEWMFWDMGYRQQSWPSFG
jgi:thiaminase/transcriptional activator TenA